jgi:hypothetical protein
MVAVKIAVLFFIEKIIHISLFTKPKFMAANLKCATE